MNIRKLDETIDLDAFKAIRVESTIDAPESFRATVDEMKSKPIETFRKQLLGQADKMTFIGAYDEIDLVGVAALYYEKSEKLSHKATVGSVFVTRSHRGKGIGKKLMRELLRLGKEEENLVQLNLTVTTTNEVAVTLYKKLGFTIFGTEKNAAIVEGRSYDEHYMQLVF